MRSWLISLNGTVTLSLIALLTFLGRGFMDWRYEFPLKDPSGAWDVPGALIHMALVGGWIWSLLTAARGSRRGQIANLLFALVLNVAFALATYFVFCPPWTSCEGWPNMWPWNWANLTTGLLAAIASGVQLGQDRAMEPRFAKIET